MNTSEFILGVRRSGQLSANDPAYTDTVILEEGSQALVDRFAEPVSKLRQGYWLHRSVQTTSASNTNGLYRMPARAVVQGLELLEISTDGGLTYHSLNIKTQQQSLEYQEGVPGLTHSYVLEGDCVRLIPAPPAGYSIRMRWYLRPPALIAFVDVCKIVSAEGFDIVVSSDPAAVGITTSTGFDIQDADGSHEVPIVSQSASSIAAIGGGQFAINTLEEMDVTRISVGDYVRRPDQAVFPMLPKELHRPLCDYVAAMILVSKGDKEKAGILSQKAQSGIDRVVSMAQPRIRNANFTWHSNSYLRNGRGRGRGWR